MKLIENCFGKDCGIPGTTSLLKIIFSKGRQYVVHNSIRSTNSMWCSLRINLWANVSDVPDV